LAWVADYIPNRVTHSSISQSIAVELLGSVKESGCTFLSKLGREISVQLGDDGVTLLSYSAFQCYSTTRQFNL